MGEGSGRAQSEFNMAISYLNRLNGLFYLCDEYSMGMDAYNWMMTLVTLFRELSTHMKEQEIEERKTQLKQLFEMINKHNQSIMRGKTGINEELYWKLSDFELFIRRVLKESGLETKMQNDARFSLQ
jgi:hypothetical protein